MVCFILLWGHMKQDSECKAVQHRKQLESQGTVIPFDLLSVLFLIIKSQLRITSERIKRALAPVASSLFDLAHVKTTILFPV